VQIELVYEKTCPNIDAARSQLLKAFAAAGSTPHWQEWDVSDNDVPAHVHGYGSPTILVNGVDVTGRMPEGNDDCCRIYACTDQANKGVPPLADIVRAIKSAAAGPTGEQHGRSAGLNGAALPAIGVALLPKLACPACWPAYAGLLSSMGLGFIDYTPYLLPVTALFLFFAIAALAYGARVRRGYGPLGLGLVAATVIMTGKFFYDNDATMYAGLLLLVLASLWNAWPKKSPAGTLSCPACDTAGPQ